MLRNICDRPLSLALSECAAQRGVDALLVKPFLIFPMTSVSQNIFCDTLYVRIWKRGYAYSLLIDLLGPEI